ncbi:MAG: protein-L-isoaspartate(D-aspartate) O-methyltransferase [Bacteroidia bacterium]
MNEKPLFQARRKALVEKLRKEGIKNEIVLQAIAKVPRHLFVPKGLEESAYENRALPIHKNQTISQPYTVAYQTELLQPTPKLKVLEIGTGSGYQCAILCELGMTVYSVEIEVYLYQQATKILRSLGYRPYLRLGNGKLGWPTYAPFDRILLTAAAREIPHALLEQLALGGILVAPVGDPQKTQVMQRFTRTPTGTCEIETFDRFRFVSLQ